MRRYRFFALGPFTKTSGALAPGGYVTGVVTAENMDDAFEQVNTIVSVIRLKQPIIEWWVITED